MSELLFEIGCEEIPARVVPEVLAYMATRAQKLGEEHGLDVSDVKVYGTPRRLALSIAGIPEATKRSKKELLGPSVKAAFDAEGKPTRAAEGFAKTTGIPAEKLAKKTTPKGEYLFAEVEEGGVPAQKVLETFLADVLAKMPFPKSMRWGAGEEKFSRPVQWLLAVLDGRTLDVSLGALKAGNLSRGHRFMANDPFEAKDRNDYLAKLRERHVIVDPVERKQRVLEEARKAAKEAGGFLFFDEQGGATFKNDPLTRDTFFSSLLDEVTFLCETPFGVFGTFDKSALDLPREVVLSAMRLHQRYFAVCDKNGELLPAFVTIAASRVKDTALVRRGNERVLKARLSDATYFFVQDQKRELASRVDDLKAVTYHKKIGSSYEKVERVHALAVQIAVALGKTGAPSTPDVEMYLTPGDGQREGFFAKLGRAAALAKADLTTLMVGEFPELQGIVGAHYAKGEHADVVEAIRDHYRPRTADDAPATGEIAAILAIADKIDTITGIIGIGQAPTGSSDPFALRRSAIGVLRTIFDRGYDFELPVDDKSMAFITDRFLNYMLPKTPGRDADAVRAVVGAGVKNPLRAQRRVEALQKFMAAEDFPQLLETLKRAANISTKEKVEGAMDTKLLAHDDEKKLHDALSAAESACAGLRDKGTAAAYGDILAQVAHLRLTVDAFFKGVMVMDKDPAVKMNRLRLMQRITALTAGIADFTKV